RWAAQLAQAAKGRIAVVYASDPMAMSYPHPRGSTIADQREDLVRDKVADAAAGGVDISLTVEVDHPVPALARMGDRFEASVIVVGRRGSRGFRGLLLGRVPAQLPFHAGRPVAVVPRH